MSVEPHRLNLSAGDFTGCGRRLERYGRREKIEPIWGAVFIGETEPAVTDLKSSFNAGTRL